MQRPGTPEIVSPFLNAIGNYFAALRDCLVPAASIAALQSAGAQCATGKTETPAALSELLNAAPAHHDDMRATLMLARVSAEIATPILRRTTAVNALLRTKLKPVFEPLLQQMHELRQAKI